MKKLLLKMALMATGISMSLVSYAQTEEDHFSREDKPEKINHSKSHKSAFNKKDFGLYLGLNQFDKAVNMPELNQWQSRYVALQWRKNHKIATGNLVDVAIGTGFEFAWNNYMLDNKEVFAVSNSGGVDMIHTDRSYHKNKLVVANLNLPLMLQFGFNDSNFKMGFGAYGGARIRSYQKFEDMDGDKSRVHGSYNLQKFNYGLMAEAGKDDFRFFVKYDILPVFANNNPINGNTLSFGVRL